MRTKKEIRDDIDRVEKQLFYHEMKDGWDRADFDFAQSLNKRLKELKDELESVLNDGSRKTI